MATLLGRPIQHVKDRFGNGKNNNPKNKNGKAEIAPDVNGDSIDDELTDPSSLSIVPIYVETSLGEETRISAAAVIAAEAAATAATIHFATTDLLPIGNRWSIATIDLSGDWELIMSDQFKHDFDIYLTNLGQPYIFRSIALGVIGRTTEITQQTQQGKSLRIKANNMRGTWERTLVASGTEIGIDDFTPLRIPVLTADSEVVEAESWWEDDGTVHVSWLRGVRKYGGGAFESRRYLEDGGRVYVCESTFHPDEPSRRDHPNRIVWRFQRRRPAEGKGTKG